MENNADSIYINAYHQQTQKIQKLPMDELLVGMLLSQSPIDYHIEALKAQAILARTLVIYHAKVFEGSGCEKYKPADVCLEGHCFPWMDIEEARSTLQQDFNSLLEKIHTAIAHTKDKIIIIKGKPIKPYFHLCCGGSTINSEDYLGNKVVYLRKVLCDYCINYKDIINSKTFTLDQLEKNLGIKIKRENFAWGAEIPGIIEDVVRDEEGRVAQIKVGDKIFKGHHIMELLGLDSTKFGWAPQSISFETKGRGHGIGLCQQGSNAMALMGHTAEEILEYYFTGIEIINIDCSRINNPLFGKTIVIDPGHGGEEGEDNIGPTGLREKDVNLNIALSLSQLLKKSGVIVYLTRETDEYITLLQRKELANKIRPHFFISIHQNSFSNSNISGTEIYHYRGDKDSNRLAEIIMNNIVNILGFEKRGIKNADFYLLREVRSSSLHIETAYITNPDQEQQLQDNEVIDKIAYSIYKSIGEYFK